MIIVLKPRTTEENIIRVENYDQTSRIGTPIPCAEPR